MSRVVIIATILFVSLSFNIALVTAQTNQWCYTIDFKETSGASLGFYLLGPSGGYESGLGYSSVLIDNASSSIDSQFNFLRIDLPGTYTINDWSIRIESTESVFPTVATEPGSLQLWKELAGAGQTLLNQNSNGISLPHTMIVPSASKPFDADKLATFNSPRTNTKWHITSWYMAGQGQPPFPSLTNDCIINTDVDLGLLFDGINTYTGLLFVIFSLPVAVPIASSIVNMIVDAFDSAFR